MKLCYAIPTLFSALSVHGLFASTRQHHDSAVEFERWLQDGTNATITANATTATINTNTDATNITTATATTMALTTAAAANTLAPTSTTCSFAAVKAGTCDFTSQYCTLDNVYQPPGMRKFFCLMKPRGSFVKYNLTNWCFESVSDRIGQASLPNTSAATGYCTSGTMDLNFTSDYSLASVEITHELSGPAVGSIHEITTVSACDNDAANADFYFAGSFCKDPCPLLYEVNGVACSGTCTPCSNGGAVAAAWDCSNVDASLVQTCDDAKSVDPLELVLIYLRGFTKAPTLANVTRVPTASSIAAGSVPAGGTITMHPTLAPNTVAAPSKAPTYPQPSKSTATATTVAPTSTTCNFATVKAGTCDFTSHYCTLDNVYQPPGMRKFGCLMKPRGSFVKYNLTNWCFESVFDCIGQASLPNTSAATGYCTSGTMDLNFTSNYSLASVEITRELSGPAVGSIHEITTVSACNDDATNADFYFAGSFCKDPCPLLYKVNGVACNGTCTPCSNGGAVAAAWDCSNVDASLVQTCDDAKSVDPLELVLIYLKGSTKAPTPVNTTKQALTASPVAAGGVPAGGTITMRPTLGPNTKDAPTKAPTEPQPSKSTATTVTIHSKVLAMIGILAIFLLL